MKLVRLAFGIALVAASAAFSVQAQDLPQRKEWKRADLSGAPGMEVIISVSEYKPGEAIPAHFHHGLEAAYVLEGGMVTPAGKSAVPLPVGPGLNLRDVVHGGFTIAGDKPVKIFSVHIVDKGKPLYDMSKK